MQKEIVSVKSMPLTPGVPYSAAVKAGNLVFTAGFVGDDPGADVKTQTRQVLEKIKTVLEASGTSMDNALRCTVYMKNFEDFGSINEVYKEYFNEKPPARLGLEVSRMYRDFAVEIDCVALVP